MAPISDPGTVSALSDHIGDIARRILGAPNRVESNRTQLRFGTNGSVAVDIAGQNAGTWFDHENGVGGGWRELLQIKGRIADEDIPAWLERELGIGPAQHNGHDRTGKPKIVATYDYRDERGDLLFQVCRLHPKTFRQRRPKGNGWEWTTKGTRMVPYRLPELRAAAAAADGVPWRVYIVEGEKDADRLALWGLTATTNPGGAGKWRGEYNHFFNGADVVVIPDNDNAGREHADEVSRNLVPVAASIRILELTELADKGDISNWIGRSGTQNDLETLVEISPPLQSKQATAARIQATVCPVSGDPGWHKILIATEKGNPKPLLVNGVTALRLAPEWPERLFFNCFRNQVFLRGAPPWSKTKLDAPWSDYFDSLTACWLQNHGIHVSTDIAGRAVQTVAQERRYHPVLDYLNRCKWDGEPRLDRWTVDYLKTANTPYVRAVSARWMIAAVARVHEPGCKADCALILEGRQGLLKSTALRVLGQPWFADEIAELGTKDAALQLVGAWIIELAELDSIARGDVSRIKSFMSRAADRFRPPYGRNTIELPRQCVFAGTVNHNEYLRAETGGRRFWPVTCTKIDIDPLAKIRDQLWGEALYRYRAGAKWWLDTSDLNAAAADEQRERYQPDAWEEIIGRHIETLSFVTVGDILQRVLNIPPENWRQTDATRIARVLKAAGWERRQVWIGQQREWRYSRPSPVSPD